MTEKGLGDCSSTTLKGISDEFGQKKTLVTLVKDCQMKWYDHVRRMGEERKAKQVNF